MRRRPCSPSFWISLMRSEITVISCMMMVALMYGFRPIATTLKRERAPPEKRQKSPSSACELKSWLSATWLAPGIAMLAKTRTTRRRAPVKRILFLSSGSRIALARASRIFTGALSPESPRSGAQESEPRGTGFGEHEAGHVIAQLDSGHVVESRVHAAVDPAQACLGRGGAVAVEVPHHPGQNVRGDADAVVITEESGQH